MKLPNLSLYSIIFLSLYSVFSIEHVQALPENFIVLNEVYANHTGADETEYVELFGVPGTVLTNISLIVVESDAGSSNGRIDFTVNNVIGTNSYYLIGNSSGLAANYNVTSNTEINDNFLENSSFAIALVETASLTDTVVNNTEVVFDTVALFDGDAGDQFFFNAPIIGPDGNFFPAGARRVQDGVDTDTTDDWLISDFSLGTDNIPMAGDTSPPHPPQALTIMQIQGEQSESPYAEARIQTTGIVTLFTRNHANFWLQDPTGDGSAITSDAIFVAGGGFPDQGTKPAVGDLIRIIAQVQESQFGHALALTRLSRVESIEVISSGQALPEPIGLTQLPAESVVDGINFWEPLEGMLVDIKNAIVVSPTSRFGEFAIISPANRKQHSGYSKKYKQLLLRQLGDQLVDYNPERILVDDSSLAEALVVKPGDKVKKLLGVVDYTFGNYKLQPVNIELKANNVQMKALNEINHKVILANKRLSVASFNVENLFDRVDNPQKNDNSSTPTAEQLETKLQKLSLAFQQELHTPDIVVVQEVENNAILQTLADRINAQAATSYETVSFETSDARGIEVGFMWNTARVSKTDAYPMTGSDVEAAFGPESTSPGREPLVGVFSFQGNALTVIGNHFKSKGGDDPLFGINQPPIRQTETQRKVQAQAVRNFVNQLLTNDPNANVIVTGDLNDFEFAEPGEGNDHPLGILQGKGDEVRLSNLILEVKKPSRFTFIFDGNSQVLDHMLISPALLQAYKKVKILHFNASYPHHLSHDVSTANRSSDHDPVLASFKF